jgi:hypothetical protein
MTTNYSTCLSRTGRVESTEQASSSTKLVALYREEEAAATTTTTRKRLLRQSLTPLTSKLLTNNVENLLVVSHQSDATQVLVGRKNLPL